MLWVQVRSVEFIVNLNVIKNYQRKKESVCQRGSEFD